MCNNNNNNNNNIITDIIIFVLAISRSDRCKPHPLNDYQRSMMEEGRELSDSYKAIVLITSNKTIKDACQLADKGIITGYHCYCYCYYCCFCYYCFCYYCCYCYYRCTQVSYCM